MDNPFLWQGLLTLTCSLAVTFNAVLLFVIFRYSTSEIKIYKYFLINLTIADLVATSLFLLLIPYPTIGNGAYGGFMLGPAKIFQSSFVSNWVFILLVTVFCYCTIALALTFVYRYVILCDIRIQQRVLSKWFVIVVSIFIFIFCVLISVTLNAARKYEVGVFIKSRFPEFSAIPDADFLGFDETNIFLPINNCLCISCNVVCDIIMAIFGYKTMKTLSKQRSRMQKKTYRMHVRLMHALIVQALLPLFVFCIPVVSFIVSILLQRTNPLVNFVAVILISLHPACNSIVTIYFIRPYRYALLDIFQCKSTRLHEIGSQTGGKTNTIARRSIVGSNVSIKY